MWAKKALSMRSMASEDGSRPIFGRDYWAYLVPLEAEGGYVRGSDRSKKISRYDK